MPKHHRPSHRAVGAVALVALACQGVTAPESSPASTLRHSTQTVPGVTVTIHVSSAAPVAGDTLRFVVTASNATAQRVQIGTECGPSFDVQVTLPNGARRSVLSDLVGPEGAFSCPLLPQHFVEPGSTQTAELRWRVPAVSGPYSASAGLRRWDGMSNLSRPIGFSVR